MALWEPAGREHNKGNSAELFGWAHPKGGAAGKTCGTVCRFSAVVLSTYTIAYLIYRYGWVVGRGTPLPIFCYHTQEGYNMKFEHLQGSIVAMITPYHPDGSVNFEVLTQLLERQIAEGTDGILVLGTTAE